MASIEKIHNRIKAARREIPCDLVFKGGRVVNVFTGETRELDVAVHDGHVVGVEKEYTGEQEIHAGGKWIVPGLIDAHIHIESSMLLPVNLAQALVPHGTSTIVSDPHEIANVQGVSGIEFFLRQSENLPVDIFFMAPSCVPATAMETSGATLDARDLRSLLKEPRVLGLAEVMNFPGVCNGDVRLLEKIALFKCLILEGHCPGLASYDLQAYVSAGIRSEHECASLEEARTKLEAGMFIMIREGSLARNLEALLPLVTPETAGRCCFVSDDLAPEVLLGRGHLDHMIRRAVSGGLRPETAVRLATLSPAEFYGFRDRGAVAPGYRADILVVEDLESFSIVSVYKDGNPVFEDGRVMGDIKHGGIGNERKTLRTGPIGLERFQIQDRGGLARVIELVPGQLYTGQKMERPKVLEGFVVPDVQRDILKISVVERHHATGNTGLGLISGFGLKSGALAGSVAHDSHNIVGVGADDLDLVRAIEEIRDMGGGLVAVEQGRVRARVPLEIAGLLSIKPIDELARELREVNQAAQSLGCGVESPYMALSFLALPVIPTLKLTDKGLVDVTEFKHVPLFVVD